MQNCSGGYKITNAILKNDCFILFPELCEYLHTLKQYSSDLKIPVVNEMDTAEINNNRKILIKICLQMGIFSVSLPFIKSQFAACHSDDVTSSSDNQLSAI